MSLAKQEIMMKIAITSMGPDLDSPVEPRFGRCPYFLIIDPETLEFETLDNPNVALGGGAGIQSAQLLANHNVQAVLTGNCGPNAFQTLEAAQIQVIVGVSGVVRQAVEKFKSGSFSGASGPNVASHFGMASKGENKTK
jgi:predicted Fe-Mo cluster-binding NifX family protein